jgi:membrane protein implicated in regulation of membrane protease activity
MTAFIIVALAAVLFIVIVWRWLGLRRQSQRQGESFAGKSTISEQWSKEKEKKS